jgi:hypothetical protein
MIIVIFALYILNRQNIQTMKFKVRHFAILLIAIFVIVSCKQAKQPSASQAADQQKLNKEEIKEGLKKVAYPLPEPFQVYNMLNDIGAKYLGSIMNPVQNVDKYFTDKNKAVNIGVYAADLGYAATYNNQVDFKAYSTVLKRLVDDLGVSVDYSIFQNDENKEKFTNKDTLVSYISNVFYDTYSFLYAESTPSLSGLMASGAWIEGLYITTHISKDTYNNSEMVKIIYKQGESLGKLIELLQKFESDDMAKSLLNALTKLKGMYDATNGSLTEEQLKGITSAIENIRSSIIS